MSSRIEGRLKRDQGMAMIIAIFAMVFLFGVMVILFNTISGEKSRATNAAAQTEAAAAASAGLQQGVGYVLKWVPGTNTFAGSGVLTVPGILSATNTLG